MLFWVCLTRLFSRNVSFLLFFSSSMFIFYISLVNPCFGKTFLKINGSACPWVHIFFTWHHLKDNFEVCIKLFNIVFRIIWYLSREKNHFTRNGNILRFWNVILKDLIFQRQKSLPLIPPKKENVFTFIKQNVWLCS